MLPELRIGIKNLLKGNVDCFRGDRTGAIVVTNTHGSHCESTLQSAVMDCCTPVAGVAPGTALSTTPPFFLWNPTGSGKNLVILKASMGFVSGTLGAGSLLMAQVTGQAAAPTGGTELTPICTLLGALKGVGRVFQGSTVAATPTIIRPLFSMGSFIGTEPQAPTNTVDLVDGSIVIPPGVGVALQGLAGAGTAPLVLLEMLWEEVVA